MSDDEVRAVNQIQKAPTTSLTGVRRELYLRAKSTIERWDPFRGVTVEAMEEEQ